MDAPDEMVEAVAQAFMEAWWANSLHAPTDWDRMSAHARQAYLDGARAVLSVPALAEVIARDAKVREIVATLDRGVISEPPCAGPCVGCGAGPDESCHGDCRCDDGEDCWPAVLIEADREPLRRIAALYPEAGK